MGRSGAGNRGWGRTAVGGAEAGEDLVVLAAELGGFAAETLDLKRCSRIRRKPLQRDESTHTTHRIFISSQNISLLSSASHSSIDKMKIKIVVRVSMNDEKSRSKALKISVGISGVESAALAGASKDQVVVAGERIDAVELTR
ncbi:disease resistance protein RGA5-like [Salvia miltiorrhiza]|uniref:disease resistance protein RGA5-like n=1 Tax=Salvia miltiorrhiza TaxID=226208 RepID=UPI0025AC3FD7|nr:disease resistance protein RGA5-like [Salvia miltiorrhiza]